MATPLDHTKLDTKVRNQLERLREVTTVEELAEFAKDEDNLLDLPNVGVMGLASVREVLIDYNYELDWFMFVDQWVESYRDKMSRRGTRRRRP